MNTAGSVAYGWGALIVAAGVSFYYAKKEIDARRKDATLRGNRPLEKLSWEEKIAQQQSSTADKHLSPIQNSIPKESFKPPEEKNDLRQTLGIRLYDISGMDMMTD